jgi:hypothetical protein
LLEHPHVLATRPTMRWDSMDMKSIYVVETDLALSKQDPTYDEDAFEDLFIAAKGYLKANPEYDGLKIVPYRRS